MDTEYDLTDEEKLCCKYSGTSPGMYSALKEFIRRERRYPTIKDPATNRTRDRKSEEWMLAMWVRALKQSGHGPLFLRNVHCSIYFQDGSGNFPIGFVCSKSKPVVRSLGY